MNWKKLIFNKEKFDKLQQERKEKTPKKQSGGTIPAVAIVKNPTMTFDSNTIIIMDMSHSGRLDNMAKAIEIMIGRGWKIEHQSTTQSLGAPIMYTTMVKV